MSQGGSLRVLIAGAGVAGLEALLGLSRLAGERVELTLLAPTERFVYRPLLVAEPFGVGRAAELELAQVAGDAGARLRRDSLAAVDPQAGTVVTGAGEEVGYDALLVAMGASPEVAVPGALTFAGAEERARFGDLLGRLGRRDANRVAFVVPAAASWAIAAYELALLTAAERDARRLADTELLLVTHEREPLELLGPAASQLIRGELEGAGVELRAGAAAEGFEHGRLLTEAGKIELDAAVALPALVVPPIEGLPQRPEGFVITDAQMHVAGLERVWAAGDITSFPIKQGGLAAQQADVAARSIAARAGAHVALRPFRPVLRAALLSGGATRYLRSTLSAVGAGATAEATQSLWSPPGKLAAGHLDSYLAGGDAAGELVDLEPEPADEREWGRALDLVLAAADADADAGDPAGALEWLALAEKLNLVIPARYVALRDQWRQSVDPGASPDRAASRLGGRFDTAAEAVSDLRRRIGWLRKAEARTTAEMGSHLGELERGFEELEALSRETGVLPKRGRQPAD